MTITQIEVFCTVCRYLNFNKAAEALYISQPAVSKQISHLESELGVSLFERSNKSVSLTEQGKKFYEHAVVILREYREALEQCRNNRETSFKIGYFDGVKEFVFSNYVLPLISSHPELQITSESYTGRTAREALKNGEIDVLYSSSNFIMDDPDISFFYITDSRYYGYMKKDHPLAGLSVLHTYDFKDMCVIPTVRRNRHSGVKKLEEEIQKNSPNVVFIENNETIDTITLSLLTGKTVAILPYPRTTVSEFITSIPFEDTWSFRTGIYYLKNNIKVRRLLSCEQ